MWEQAPTFQPVLEAVLQHHEELLQGREVGVQGPAQAQGRLDQGFDTELHHVHEVGPLLHGVVSRTWVGGTRVEKEKLLSETHSSRPLAALRRAVPPRLGLHLAEVTGLRRAGCKTRVNPPTRNTLYARIEN